MIPWQVSLSGFAIRSVFPLPLSLGVISTLMLVSLHPHLVSIREGGIAIFPFRWGAPLPGHPHALGGIIIFGGVENGQPISPLLLSEWWTLHLDLS